MAVNFVTREQPAVDTAEAGSANEPTVGRLRQTVDVDPDAATPDQSSEPTRSARRPMGAVRAPEVLPLTVTDEVPAEHVDTAEDGNPTGHPASERADDQVPILTPDPALNHPHPVDEAGMTGFYTPAREATSDDGIVAVEPAESTQTSSATQWYVMTESLDMSLRLLAGAVLCEGAHGEMVQTIDEAVHAARFDIVDDDLWCSALVGDVWVNEIEVRGLTPVSPGSRVTIGDTTFLISESPTELTGAVPIIEDDSFLDDDDEPQEQYAGLPLFYETPAEVEEIVISEPAPRPHLAAQKARLTGNFDVVEDTPLPQEDTQEVLETLPMAEPEPQSLRTPTLRVARAKAKRFPATATLLIAVLAALGLAVYTLSDHPTAQSYWQSALAYVQPLIEDAPATTSPPPTIDPTLTQAGEPAAPETPAAEPTEETSQAIFEPVQEPAQDTASPSAPDLSRDTRFNELTSLIWLDDITSASHQRTLTLLSDLLPAHGTAVEEHVRHYISRLSGISEGVRLESLTTSLAATLAGHRIYEEDMRGLEAQVREMTQGMRELALLHAQAADLFARDAITLPPGRNVVATAKEMLAIDPDNVQANRWLTRAADVMVERAQRSLARGDAFNARSLIEDVRAFNPNHGGARALWRQLSDY